MTNRTILIKPIITEKSEMLTEKYNQYVFLVNRKANKVEIKKEVEKRYNVAVDSVNTMIVPGKKKVRYTKAGVQKGGTSAYKKAIVRLAEGEEIDFYADI